MIHPGYGMVINVFIVLGVCFALGVAVPEAPLWVVLVVAVGIGLARSFGRMEQKR